MSLVAVYDALKSASVPDEKARAAVEAIETGQDREWKGQVNERLTRLETLGRVNMGVSLAILAILVASIWA